ncbi:hypothetical protein [Mycobacterium sp.]|uniref:hypothetical protein n=1 Tax=Mycobacterium sp. TaxID=1785 RepID=UPI003BA9E425
MWTLPAAQLRRIPLVRSVHTRLLRRRFSRTITAVVGNYRSGRLSGGQAASAMSRTLRSFLNISTGARAQYMHIDDITNDTQLTTTAPVFAALNDAQFATEPADVDRAAQATMAVIRTWT